MADSNEDPGSGSSTPQEIAAGFSGITESDEGLSYDLTWEVGMTEVDCDCTDVASGETIGMELSVPDGKDILKALKELIISQAEDAFQNAKAIGEDPKWEDVDFWIGDKSFEHPSLERK